MTRNELKTRIETNLAGMTSRHALLKMVAAAKPTTLADYAVIAYQQGPRNVAGIVEQMIEIGIVIADGENRCWWPSQLEKLRDILAGMTLPGGMAVTGNPPVIVSKTSSTGSRTCEPIVDATVEAVEKAVADAVADETRQDKTSSRLRQAQRDLDNS